jgi:hypothetical protein
LTRSGGECEFYRESTVGGFFGENQAPVQLDNSPCEAEAESESSACGSAGEKRVEEVMADGVGFESGAVIEDCNGDDIGGSFADGDLDESCAIGSSDGFHGVSDEAGYELSQQGSVKSCCDFFIGGQQTQLDTKFCGRRFESFEGFADGGDEVQGLQIGLWGASEEH